MSEFPKAIRKKLERLAGIAHERELDEELKELERSFKEWRTEEINAFALSDRVHKFHSGPNRNLWKLYNALDPPQAVARAVALGILQRDEVPQEALEEMALAIEYFEKYG